MSKEMDPEDEALAPLPDTGEDEHEDADEHHVSFAARSLQILALVAVSVVFGLWAGPRVAPHLPKGMAPVAAWLSPQTNASTDALAALRAETNLRLAVLEAGIKREEIETRLANFQTDIVNPLRDQMKALSDQMAASNTTAIEARLWAVEGKVEGLIAELESLRQMLGNVAAEGGTISADTAASIAAYRTRIDALQAQVNEITARQGALTTAVARAQSTASQQVEEAQALVEEASETALSAQSQTALATALIEVETALQTGASFAASLGAASDVSGKPAPAALLASAGGIATLDKLEEDYPLVAHAAIRADIAAGQNDGGLSGLGSFLRSQVATRSLTPQQGGSADAVLSRLEAALKLDDMAGVLAEADTLPEAAAPEMADWLARVSARKAALDGFTEWRGALEASEE
ncbi:MAG: hypothetical protein COB08_003895 [Rhodobacteraceae bacterium]|nr:hypothetical protein [Paracoccaceae bacterium]